MAVSYKPIFVQAANVACVQFAAADTTTLKTLFTPGANGSRIKSINLVSDDSATINLDLYLTVSAVDYRIGTAQITTGLGFTAATASVEALNPGFIAGLDADGSLFLPFGTVLKGAAKATITAAKTLHVVSLGEDY